MAHRQFSSNKLPGSLSSLTGDALRMVIERPSFWEYRLFVAILNKVFDDARPKRLDWELGFSIGQVKIVTNEKAFSLHHTRIESLLQLMDMFRRLFAQSTQEAAFGPPGVPGDPERIVHLARRIGELYTSLLEWSLELRRVRATEVMRPLFDHVASGISSVIGEFDKFHSDLTATIADLVQNPPKPGEKRTIKMEIVLELPPDFEETHDRILMDIARNLGLQ